MRKFVYTLLVGFSFFIQPLKAQTIAGHLGFSKGTWEFDKKLILAELMEFDKKESLAFWPV